MRTFASVLAVIVSTLLLGFGVSWLLPLASRPSDLFFAIGLGGTVLCFYLFWEVLKRCVNTIRREVQETTTKHN